MKVILNQAIPKVGKAGQVVVVKDGYARNFLFPQGLATFADRTQIKALEIRMARMEAKLAETKAAAEATKVKLDGLVMKIEGKVGKDANKLFGAVTSQDVIDRIKKETGIIVEKKQVAIVEPIKRLGKFSVLIDLHRDVDAHVIVHVFDPEAPEVVEAPVEEVASEPEAVEA